MQVHKETIDKVPNALPNKNSVDIEIYGMEGIPEEDIREHERQKQDRSESVEPRGMGGAGQILLRRAWPTAGAHSLLERADFVIPWVGGFCFGSLPSAYASPNSQLEAVS